jgi:hypothetical protein
VLCFLGRESKAQQKLMTNKDDFFSEGNRASTAWFKFEKIGDAIKGTLVGKRKQEGEGDFPDQIIYELNTEDGDFVNVGFSVNKKGTHERMRNVKFGQIVGFKYEADIPAKTKGYAAAKAIGVYVGGFDEKYQREEEREDEVKVDDIPFN